MQIVGVKLSFLLKETNLIIFEYLAKVRDFTTMSARKLRIRLVSLCLTYLGYKGVSSPLFSIETILYSYFHIFLVFLVILTLVLASNSQYLQTKIDR